MPSEEGWAHCGSICYTQWPRFAQMPQLTTFSQQCQNIENAALVFSWLSLHIHHHSPPPKGPIWEKYISKFDREVIKPAVRREPRAAWTTLWAFGLVVSSLWVCYMAKSKSHLISWWTLVLLLIFLLIFDSWAGRHVTWKKPFNIFDADAVIDVARFSLIWDILRLEEMLCG